MEAAGLLLQEEQKRREATADINHRGAGIPIPHVAEIGDQTCAAISLHSRQKARHSQTTPYFYNNSLIELISQQVSIA